MADGDPQHENLEGAKEFDEFDSCNWHMIDTRASKEQSNVTVTRTLDRTSEARIEFCVPVRAAGFDIRGVREGHEDVETLYFAVRRYGYRFKNLGLQLPRNPENLDLTRSEELTVDNITQFCGKGEETARLGQLFNTAEGGLAFGRIRKCRRRRNSKTTWVVLNLWPVDQACDTNLFGDTLWVL